MDILSITIREWLSMHIDNGTRLVRFLNILYFILENILDSFSGRHWAFMCSTVHAAFSGHFEPVSISSYLSLPLQSIFSLLLSRPLVLTNWLMICPLQIVWFVSWFRFTNSRDFQHQNFWALCCFLQLIFFPFYFLSNLWETSHLSLKLFPMQRITNSHQLSSSIITQLDPSDIPSEDVQDQDDVEAHLERQHELDLQEQNAHDCEAFNDFITGSGYNGICWDELESSLW